MKIENNYDKLKKMGEETSPLPKEPHDIPTRAIDTELYDDTEDKAQIELEVDIEKNGVPTIDVERPPIPDVHTDSTPYKKVGVARKVKKSDGKEIEVETKLSIMEDREMKAYAEKFCIPKRKSFLQRMIKEIYDLSCKIKKIVFNVVSKNKRKKIKFLHYAHDEHVLPEDMKRVNLKDATEVDINELGRKRSFKRDGDRTSDTINMVRNKKTGVVVATPSVEAYKVELEDNDKDAGDYEVVESKIKD